MRKHIILFFSALTFLFACKGGNSTDGILKEDVMVHLLADVHIVDGSLALQVGVDSIYKYGTGRYMYVLKQYHTDSAQFKRSVKYYTTQPEILIKIYADVSKVLQTKYDSVNKIVVVENSKKVKEDIEKAKRSEKLKSDSLKKDSISKSLRQSQISKKKFGSKKISIKLKNETTSSLKK